LTDDKIILLIIILIEKSQCSICRTALKKKTVKHPDTVFTGCFTGYLFVHKDAN